MSGTPRSLASFAVIAGQHAKAAGVNRQRLVQRESRRVARSAGRRCGMVSSPTRCCARSSRRRERAMARSCTSRNAASAIAASSFARDHPEPSSAGCVGGAPQSVVETAEHGARVGCQLHQRSVASSSEAADTRWKGKPDAGLDSWVDAPTRAANFVRSMFPPETTATFSMPRAAAHGGGDGAARRPFSDHPRTLRHEPCPAPPRPARRRWSPRAARAAATWL